MTHQTPPDSILLLTGETEAPHLIAMLKAERPDLTVLTRPSLKAGWPDGLGKGTRLISFGFGELVPGERLAQLGSAYNFHPGTPDYPGRHPAAFAAYDQAPNFGATLHEMAGKADSGAILAVDRRPMPPGATRLGYSEAAFGAMARLFALWAPRLAGETGPFPPSGERWSGAHCTAARAKHMLDGLNQLELAEAERRQIAFAGLTSV